MILFSRKESDLLLQFLQIQVFEKHRSVFVLGPPGTGKTMTVLAFVSGVETGDYVITWIQIKKDSTALVCSRYTADSVKMFPLDPQDLAEFLKIEVTKPHVIVVDGFYLSVKKHEAIISAMKNWRNVDRTKRYSIFSCSLSSRDEEDSKHDSVEQIEEFFMPSWTMNQYTEATSDPSFLTQVDQYLDATSDKDLNKRLASKFALGGGSVRFTLGKKSKEVVKIISDFIDSIPAIESFILSTPGPRAPSTQNQLWNVRENVSVCGKVIKESTIISQFAADMISFLIKTPIILNRFQELLSSDINRPMSGWIFEILFFYYLKYGELKLTDSNPIQPFIGNQKVLQVDTSDIPVIDSTRGTWFKPMAFNEAGLDGFYCDLSKNYLLIVQVTISRTHDCNFVHFTNLIDKIRRSNPSYVIHKLDIYYIVETDVINSFDLNIIGQNLLYRHGLREWEPKLARNKIRVIGMSR
jgi:hypothetical protein